VRPGRSGVVNRTERTAAKSPARFFRHAEWELYRFGLRVGWHTLRAGGVRRLGLQKTAGKILQPIITPTRFAEYAAVASQLPPDMRLVLDVGSPKIFGLWLAAHRPVVLVATDVWHLPTAEYALAWQRLAREQPTRGQVHFVTTDGTLTCFRPSTFDCMYAVSVIEHIEGDGDTRFLDEAARLLVPGGRLVITVPFAARYEEQYTQKQVYRPRAKDGPVFFQRVYDRQAAQRRLLHHDLLAVRAVKTLAFEPTQLLRLWDRLPMRVRGALGFLNPVLSGLAPGTTLDGFADPPATRRNDERRFGDLLLVYERHT
jgi:SAM-dependent methyltransferase